MTPCLCGHSAHPHISCPVSACGCDWWRPDARLIPAQLALFQALNPEISATRGEAS
jgi:hypothetical protein